MPRTSPPKTIHLPTELCDMIVADIDDLKDILSLRLVCKSFTISFAPYVCYRPSKGARTFNIWFDEDGVQEAELLAQSTLAPHVRSINFKTRQLWTLKVVHQEKVDSETVNSFDPEEVDPLRPLVRFRIPDQVEPYGDEEARLAEMDPDSEEYWYYRPRSMKNHIYFRHEIESYHLEGFPKAWIRHDARFPDWEVSMKYFSCDELRTFNWGLLPTTIQRMGEAISRLRGVHEVLSDSSAWLHTEAQNVDGKIVAKGTTLYHRDVDPSRLLCDHDSTCGLNSYWPGVNEFAKIAASVTTNAQGWVNLRRLDLSFYATTELELARAPVSNKVQNLVTFIAQCPHLGHLALRARGPLYESFGTAVIPEMQGIVVALHLRQMVFSQLESLILHHIDPTRDDVLGFIEAHKPTLKTLEVPVCLRFAHTERLAHFLSIVDAMPHRERFLFSYFSGDGWWTDKDLSTIKHLLEVHGSGEHIIQYLGIWRKIERIPDEEVDLQELIEGVRSLDSPATLEDVSSWFWG